MRAIALRRRLGYMALLTPRMEWPQTLRSFTSRAFSQSQRVAPTSTPVVMQNPQSRSAALFRPFLGVLTLSMMMIATQQVESDAVNTHGAKIREIKDRADGADQEDHKESQPTTAAHLVEEKELKKYYLDQVIPYGETQQGEAQTRDFSDQGGFVSLVLRLTDLAAAASLTVNKRLDESVHKLLSQHTAIRESRTPFHEWINAFWESMGNHHYTLQDFFKMLSMPAEVKESKKVLVLGEPGAGKTILCQKIAHGWADEDKADSAIKDFDFVFYVDLASLSEFAGYPNLLQQAKHLLLADGTQMAVPDAWQGKKILWILDNYDRIARQDEVDQQTGQVERREKVDKFIAEIPSLQPWAVMVASRHYAYPAATYTQTFTVEGFTDEGVNQYIAKFHDVRPDATESADPAKVVRLSRLSQLAEAAGTRKMFHLPYYLRLLCISAQEPYVNNISQDRANQWLTRVAKFSRTAFLDQYAMHLLKKRVTDEKLLAALKDPKQQRLVGLLHANYHLKAVLQPLFTDEILKIFFASCDLTCQVLSKDSKDKFPPTFVANKYHPANQLKWVFIAGHLALFHELHPEYGKAPGILLEQFGYNSTPGPHKDLFGFYENALLIRCIDELSGTHQATSIHYYAIIARLGKWFELLLSVEDSEGNWLMHPLIKEAIASSDFIFKDAVIGDLFREKLTKLQAQKKTHLLMKLMQVISAIQLNDEKLNGEIQKIIFNQHNDVVLRCSAMVNQLVLLAKRAAISDEFLQCQLPKLQAQLIDPSENLLIRAFSCFSLAMLVKNKVISSDEINTTLIPALRNSNDLVVRAANIYILGFYPAPNPLQTAAHAQASQNYAACRQVLIDELKKIESSDQEDTWVRCLACKALSNFEQQGAVVTHNPQYYDNQLRRYYQYIFKNTLEKLSLWTQFDMFMDVLRAEGLEAFFQALPGTVQRWVKPTQAVVEFKDLQTVEKLTPEHLQDLADYLINKPMKDVVPLIDGVSKEALISKKRYEEAWVKTISVAFHLWWSGDVAQLAGQITSFAENKPVEQLINEFAKVKDHLDRLIATMDQPAITVLIDRSRQLPGKHLNDFTAYLLTFYVIFKSLEHETSQLTPLDLLARRHDMQKFVDHVAVQVTDGAHGAIPEHFKQALTTACVIVRKHHDQLFAADDKDKPLRYSNTLAWLQDYVQRHAPALTQFTFSSLVFVLEKQIRELALFKIDFAVANQLSRDVMPTRLDRAIYIKTPAGQARLQSIAIYAIYSGSAVTVEKSSDAKQSSQLLIQSPLLTAPIQFNIVDATAEEVIQALSATIPQEVSHVIAFSPSPLLQLFKNKTADIRRLINNLDHAADKTLARQQIIQEMKALFTQHPDCVNEQDVLGETLLMLVVKKGEVALVNALIHHQADINVTNYQYASVINIAAAKLSENIASEVLAVTYKNILAALFAARQLPSQLMVNDAFKAINYFITDASDEKLRIYVSAAAHLSPGDAKATIMADPQQVIKEMKRLVINDWRWGLSEGENTTRIEDQMPYYLLGLLVCGIKLLAEPEKNAQGLIIIANEIRVLSEMMAINKSRLVIRDIAQTDFQRELKLTVVDNLHTKIQALAKSVPGAQSEFKEIVVPICDLTQQHCFYLAVRVTPVGYIFRVENLSFQDNLSEVKEFHDYRLLEDKMAIAPAILLSGETMQLTNPDIQIRIKSMLGRAIWNEEMIRVDVYQNYPILVKQPSFPGLVFSLFSVIYSICHYLRVILREPPARILRLLSANVLLDLQQWGGSFAILPVTFLVLWILYHVNFNIKKEGHSIYRDYQEFAEFGRQVQQSGYEFLPFDKQRIDNCVYENYIATIKNRVYCFFQEHADKQGGTLIDKQQRVEQAQTAALDFHQSYMKPYFPAKL